MAVSSTNAAPYRAFTTNIIPQVTEVRLYPETVEKVAANHTEITTGFSVIEDTIEQVLTSPSHVEKSYNNSYVFVDKKLTNASGDHFRLPVKVVDGTSARIKSFYFATPNSTTNVIWNESDGE